MAMLRAHRAEILHLAARRGVSNIRVFGSVARGDATPDSDIDLLVDFEVRDSGLDLVAFEMELESLLGYRVEAGTSIHASIRDRVESEAIPL
jgi:predicted nucleotidyltransferase